MYKMDIYAYASKMNDFNKLCENNNENINAFINCICDGAPMKVKVDLKDVLIFMNGGTEVGMEISKTETICRLCFEKVKVTDSVCLNERSGISNMVTALFPEMDFSSTENPMICPECLKNATQQFRLKVKNSKNPTKYCMSFFTTSQENENKINSQDTSPVDLNEQFVQNCQKLSKILQGSDTPRACNDFTRRSHLPAPARSVINLKETCSSDLNFKYLDNKKSIMSLHKTKKNSNKRSLTLEAYERFLNSEMDKEISLMQRKIMMKKEDACLDRKIKMEEMNEFQHNGKRSEKIQLVNRKD